MNKFFVFFAFVVSTAAGRITEVATIQEFCACVQQESQGYNAADVLVVCDIDNTLATPVTHLGSDQWFDHMIGQRMAEGHDSHQALTLTLSSYCYSQYKTPLRCVEPATLRSVQLLQEAGFTVVCLTARSLHLADRTIEQLAALDLRFSFNAFKEFVLPLKYTALFKEGILFCDGNGKGDVLKCFLQHVGYAPKKIIMIDDKRKHLGAVEKTFSVEGCDFVGCRYSYCDAAVADYNHAHAEREWHTLRHK